MADYQKMYIMLFRKVTKAIALLQEAQIEAEEIFIMSDNTNIQALDPNLKSVNTDDKNDE